MAQPDFDVIVIGGGGAGMSAALMAAEKSKRVLLVEAGTRCGGATALSGGAFYAAGTDVQKQAGIIGDNAEAMYDYGMIFNRYRMEPSVFRRYCEATSEALHWLIGLGVNFPTERVTVADISGVGRAHWAEGRGAAIAERLEGHLSARGVEVAVNTRVRRLVVENGSVVGIEVDGECIRSKAVVIATGGFGANPELLARHYPATNSVAGTWYIGPKTSQGDAIELGAMAGADMTGENRGLRLMSPGLRETNEMVPAWLILVNRLGRRFMNEAAPYCVFDSALEGQPDNVGFAIFDQQTLDKPPRDMRYAAAVDGGILGTDWIPDVLKAGVDAGQILKADTLEELAEKAGIRAGALVETIRNFNVDVSSGKDTMFDKPREFLHAIGEGPFYAAKMTMQTLCLTSYGLRIDECARVLDTAGKPIAGLYAAGEASGGLMGEVYLGSGNSISNAVTMGRIAGENAALWSDPG